MSTTEATPAGENNPIKVSIIPQSDVDLKDVSKQVCTTWGDNPLLTMLWLTQPDFETLVDEFGNVYTIRKSTGGTRPEVTRKLLQLDKTMNTDIENIKRYLVEKYTKTEAPSYYPAFGIVKTGKLFKLPTDRDERKAALDLLLPAITLHGFDSKPYGLAYWTDVKTRYDALMAQASSIDSAVSSKVGDKNVLKSKIKKALNALIHLIKANYPDTYKAELRSWGFQKEKY